MGLKDESLSCVELASCSVEAKSDSGVSSSGPKFGSAMAWLSVFTVELCSVDRILTMQCAVMNSRC